MRSIFIKCLLRMLISFWQLLLLCRPSFGIRRLSFLVVFAIPVIPALVGSKTAAAESQVSVLYAGSLGNLMEMDVGPSFTRGTGYKYLGEAKGSLLSANLIKEKLRTPDVFISADPKVNQMLMGKENGDLVRWYATIFGNEMVLGYNPNSRFAADTRSCRRKGSDSAAATQNSSRRATGPCSFLIWRKSITSNRDWRRRS